MFLRPRIIRDIGRPRKAVTLEAKARQQRKRDLVKEQRLDHVAMLDFETDPFDNKNPDAKIEPFAACLYPGRGLAPIIIWEAEINLFIARLLEALENLDGNYMIFAHNGGKFDFMFLVKQLRGKVSFKGRGIMAAKIGRHELRDSFHIIPEKLAGYRKDDFLYWKLEKKHREKHKTEIIQYMSHDCEYLYDLVIGFLREFGIKISIGQAAMSELKKLYKVGNIGEHLDADLRRWFFGGRVECIQGSGHFIGAYRMYDINSDYPNCMANYLHPISSTYDFRRNGGIKANTCFLEIECENRGAFVMRGSNNETTATIKYGRFFTTIHEFKVAVELELISKIKIHQYVDNLELGSFPEYVLPRYEKRLILKDKMDAMEKEGLDESMEYFEIKRDATFIKLILNNTFGKWAQNPRRFKEHFITDHGEIAPKGFENCLLPEFSSETLGYDIWSKPTERLQFNNVGTAASITGAARSILLRAIHNAVDPIYCDTDSLICKELLNTEIHQSKLGAWKFEKEFSEVIIAGKKTYSYRQIIKGKTVDKFKAKGAPAGSLNWNDMLNLVNGGSKSVTSMGPTLTKTGKQYYMTRTIRATA